MRISAGAITKSESRSMGWSHFLRAHVSSDEKQPSLQVGEVLRVASTRSTRRLRQRSGSFTHRCNQASLQSGLLRRHKARIAIKPGPAQYFLKRRQQAIGRIRQLVLDPQRFLREDGSRHQSVLLELAQL